MLYERHSFFLYRKYFNGRICDASIYATYSRTAARLDCLHSSFSLRIQSHSISRAWLTFNRRRDSSLSSLFSLRAFRRRSQPNSNVPFDRVARTQNVTCASNMCPRSSLSLFTSLSLSLYLFRRRGDFSSFLLVLIARGKYRGATRAHLASLGARADAVSHIRMLLFLVTRRGESRSTANSPTLARVTYVPRH